MVNSVLYFRSACRCYCTRHGTSSCRTSSVSYRLNTRLVLQCWFDLRVKVTGYRCVPRVRARASGRAIPIQRNSTAVRHVYICARALIIIAIYNACVSAGAVKWQDKDRFDSCCTRNQPRHSIIVFIASQIPYNEIHFLTTSICTVIAA